jgi:hypothetical protein
VDDPHYSRLQFMFGAYFHQDWITEGDDWPNLMANYAKDQTSEELEATAEELNRFLVECADDATLSKRLYRDLWCEYDPRPDLGGPTVRMWLSQVAEWLRARVGRAEQGAAADGSRDLGS